MQTRLRTIPFVFFAVCLATYFIAGLPGCSVFFLLNPGFLPMHFVMGISVFVNSLVLMPADPKRPVPEKSTYEQNFVWLEDDRR